MAKHGLLDRQDGQKKKKMRWKTGTESNGVGKIRLGSGSLRGGGERYSSYSASNLETSSDRVKEVA